MRKNFRKIPKHISEKLEAFQSSTITTFAFLKASKQDIIDGKFAYLNINIKDDQLSYPEYLIPDEAVGRYSKYNLEGRLIKLKDLPKVEVVHSFDSPNFGDSSKGYHTTTITHKVYQTKLIPPKFLCLIFSLNPSANEDQYIFKVYINTPLSKTSGTFYEDLLFQINLLQENIHDCNITDTNILDEKYIDTQSVEWELLPPGTLDVDELISKMVSPKDINNPTIRAFMKERLDFFNGLGALQYIKGTNVLSSYKGAKFSENIVLLENFDYGNAVYIFKENWEALTQLSRTELLSNHSESIIRIKHTVNWKNNIETALHTLLK
ncbi:MAG: hypothetical protein K0S76_1003 [Herbinix sp.]|jgi:hypothetical protein|nr:hypothetical protein [Herbinix sp.]